MSLRRASLSALALTVVGLLAVPAGAPAAFSVATQASPSFGLALDGTDQTGVSALVVRVTQTDAGANGKTGWNLTIDSTPLQSAGGARLAPDATSLVSSGYTCAVGPCTNPTNTVAPVPIPAGSPPPAAVKVFNAARNTGLGVFDLFENLQTSVRANADAGTYTSTMTVALVRGP